MTDEADTDKTRKGQVLFDAQREAMADEAEGGYDPEVLEPRRRVP